MLDDSLSRPISQATATNPPGPSGESNAIEARALRKTYRASGKQKPKEALKGIDLMIPRGSIFGLLGPNGAGKSTFINILAGLTVKTGGNVRIWGFDIDVNPRQSRASIGVVPQELNVDPFFTPAELLNLQAGLYGVPRRRRKTQEILKAMSLEDKSYSYARTLSGGMRRRLLVAKAMVHDPPVLVLDEPTAGVDVELRRQLWAYIRRLNRRGATIVLTTHYLEEAQAMCDRIAIIDSGEVVACDSTPALLQRIDLRTLTITPDTPIASVPGALSGPEALPGLEVSLDNAGRLTIRYHARDTRVADILARLTAAGIGIADMTSREADLEDVFVRLTSHSD